MNMNTYSVEFIIKILQNSRQYAYHATFNKHAWDYLDQLQSASNGTFTSYYNYDSEGNRTRKVVVKPGGIIEERYYLDGYEVYRKYLNNNLDLERKTINVYDVKLFDKNNDDNEDKENKSYSIDKNKKFAIIDIKTVENGTTLPNPNTIIRYQYDNHLGSACLELDNTAAIISYEEYHPFGTTSYRSGRNEVDVSLKRYKYIGKEKDEETGLYYYGARYYAGWLGRWISVDPLKEKYLNLTPYNYCANNPVMLRDPDGRIPIPIIPWLLKAGAGAAADMMAQASMDYLFNPNTKSWSQAFDNVNWWQVGRSGAEGLIPWRTPGGKIGRAAGTAIVDVLVNAANNPSGYTAEQAGMDFTIGFIGDLAGGGFGQVLNKYGSKAVINGLMDKLGYSATQIRKMTGGFDGDAVRKWYKDNVDAINVNIDPTEANARSVVNQRNTLKQQARDLMSDQKAAANLPEIQSYDYYYQKAYDTGYRGEELYQQIINGGTRTNKSYNKKYGE